MSIYEFINGIGNGNILIMLLVGVASLVEIAPIKINPISWLLSKLGNTLNRDLKKEIDAVNSKLDQHIKESQEETARKWRNDILNFCNAELNHHRHTKEQWDEVIPSCTAYEKFCTDKGIQNDKASKAIAELNRRYDRHMANEDFLTEDED